MAPTSEKRLEQYLPEGQLVNRTWFKRADSAVHGWTMPCGREIWNLWPVGFTDGRGRRSSGSTWSTPLARWAVLCMWAAAVPWSCRVWLIICQPGGVRRIDLRSPNKIPPWVADFPAPFRFDIHTQNLFGEITADIERHIPRVVENIKAPLTPCKKFV